MEKTFFILDKIYKLSNIPVHILNGKGDMVLFMRGINAKEDPVVASKMLRDRLIDNTYTRMRPVVHKEENQLYGEFSDELGNIIIMGPLEQQLEEELSLKDENTSKLVSALSVLYSTVTGKHITDSEIISKRKPLREDLISEELLVKSSLEDEEDNISNIDVLENHQFFKHIKDGNPDAVQRIALHRMSALRKLDQNDHEYKQAEYMASSAVTLAYKAAVDGGLNQKQARRKADMYLQKLEKCENTKDIYALMQQCVLDYAQCVKKENEDKIKCTYVEQSKQYILKNINRSFTNDEISHEIGVEKSYLSRLFSAQKGIGIQRYALERRIEAACHILQSSDSSIEEIAEYLCFSSQSHFGKVFKEIVGQTPLKYRQKNRKIEI